MPRRRRAPTPIDLPLAPLRLEATQGYADTAVAGGLGAFMRRWAEEAGAQASTEAARQALFGLAALFASYATATTERRRGMVSSS